MLGQKPTDARNARKETTSPKGRTPKGGAPPGGGALVELEYRGSVEQDHLAGLDDGTSLESADVDAGR
jgi:hypothetical protein